MSNKEKTYLGIDWGEARIGLAVGDNVVNLATPFGVVPNIEELKEVIKKEFVDELVIGVPYKMRDHQEDVNELFLLFLDKLRKEVSLPIHTIDERLSSKGADALVGDKKTKSSRDSIAAMIILQTFLDREQL